MYIMDDNLVSKDFNFIGGADCARYFRIVCLSMICIGCNGADG